MHCHSPLFCNGAEQLVWGYNQGSGEGFNARPRAKKKALDNTQFIQGKTKGKKESSPKFKI